MSEKLPKFVFHYHSPTARKARFVARISPQFRILISVAAGLFVIAGASLWAVSSSVLGSIILATAVCLFLPIVSIHYDVGRMVPKLHVAQTNTVALEEAFHIDIVGRLHAHSSLFDVCSALMHSWEVKHFFVRFGIPGSLIKDALPHEKNDAEFQTVMRRAFEINAQTQSKYLSPVAVIIAALETMPDYDTILAQTRLDRSDVLEAVRWMHHENDVLQQMRHHERVGGIARDWTSGFTPTLNLISVSISAEIERGSFAHVSTATHEKTIVEMLNNLQKPRSNVLLVGDVGSGKTICTYALAKHLLEDKTISGPIRFAKVHKMSASAIISSSPSSDRVEASLYSIVNEAARARDIILFFESAANLFTTAEGAVDVRRAVLEIVKNAPVPIILEMTPTEWQKVSYENQELSGLLNIVHVPESDKSTTMDILEDYCIGLEAQHGVMVTYKALQESIELAQRYVEGFVLPGQAISVLESAVGHATNNLVTETSVAQAVEAMYGVKVQIANQVEGRELLNLEDRIHERMVNQTRAVKVVSDALRRARSGVGNPKRPIGTFLFLGPTGVGKTELSLAVSDIYFGGEHKITRVDMNEFTQSSDLYRLLDTQVPTSMLSVVARERFGVVLFDEIEKAHPDVVNAFLQLLDEGQMRDATNRVISFRDTIVIATSNAGADRIRSYIEQGKEVEQFEQGFVDELIHANIFRPEFINRFDEIVVFRPLKEHELMQVTDRMIAEVNKTLAHQKVSVFLTDEAKAWLVKHGNDPRLGARPLRRVIQRTVENIVAKKVLSGELQPGALISLGVPDLESE